MHHHNKTFASPPTLTLLNDTAASGINQGPGTPTGRRLGPDAPNSMNFCTWPPATRHPSADCFGYFLPAVLVFHFWLPDALFSCEYQLHHLHSPTFLPPSHSFSFWPAGPAEEVAELRSGLRRSSSEETRIQADLLDLVLQFVLLTGRRSVALLRQPQHPAATRRPTSKRAPSSSCGCSEITARGRIGSRGETTATMLGIIWRLRGSHLIWKQFASSSLSIFSVGGFYWIVCLLFRYHVEVIGCEKEKKQPKSHESLCESPCQTSWCTCSSSSTQLKHCSNILSSDSSDGVQRSVFSLDPQQNSDRDSSKSIYQNQFIVQVINKFSWFFFCLFYKSLVL